MPKEDPRKAFLDPRTVRELRVSYVQGLRQIERHKWIRRAADKMNELVKELLKASDYDMRVPVSEITQDLHKAQKEYEDRVMLVWHVEDDDPKWVQHYIDHGHKEQS